MTLTKDTCVLAEKMYICILALNHCKCKADFVYMKLNRLYDAVPDDPAAAVVRGISGSGCSAGLQATDNPGVTISHKVGTL